MDVFTDCRFGGNPLAIFPDASQVPPDMMPQIARELNLSETVFLFPPDSEGAIPMRIFTPASELPTAGHPTIGTAYYLASQLTHPPKDGYVDFWLQQKVGKIRSRAYFEDGKPTHTTMQQLLPEFGKIYENRDDFAHLLGLAPADLAPTPIQVISCGVPFVFVPVKTLAAVARIRFQLHHWEQVKESLSQAFVYAFTLEAERKGSDVHGRMFAPEAGISEDPATGSANGPLGCYLTRYGLKTGKLVSEQGFEMGRPSLIGIEIEKSESGAIRRVVISGQSVDVGTGLFFMD